MKYKISFLFFFLIPFLLFSQENSRTEYVIPDILGFQTLKCDFHMHTIYSDGEVLPLVRVREAWSGGLDVIAITDHIEWWLHEEGEGANRNKPYEDALSHAEKKGLVLIRAIEITKGMPPGHLNLLFLKDADKIDREDYKQALTEAKKQGAFVFWNHPGWARQAPDGIKWYVEHTEILSNGWMQGIEVVNWNEYYPEAIDWCLEKNLTLVGNSDMHMPVNTYLSEQELQHRPITLVFSKSKKQDDIKEALVERRTAVWFENSLIGEQKYLTEIFHQSVEVKSILKTSESKYFVQVYNKSSLQFDLENEIGKIHLLPGKTTGFNIDSDVKPESISFKVINLKVSGKTVLETSLNF